ncbi:MAG TPA: glycoside hydrolase family 25 protein [Blastocatellia bacterium]|nr:glycoside hydrolase family 25 protein [Blastocatellia bacterium]
MPDLNVVVDISHHNGEVDLDKAKTAGILGVIHKATQSTTYTDPNYAANRDKAAAAGLLWGAYHFGTGGDGVEQADYFLSVVGPGPNDLLVLDLEDNPQGSSMALDGAHDFVTRVYDTTGTWPGLYSGSYIKQLLGTNKDSVLANCWFWLAQYGPSAIVPANWPTWTMWQYTDGAVGPQPHTVDGIGSCDRDKFNGDEPGLRRLWGF